MREVTFQIVMRLDDETGDDEVRLIEYKLRKSAKRNLIFGSESASVGKIMDRKVEGE
jgi:hypothetical protein